MKSSLSWSSPALFAALLSLSSQILPLAFAATSPASTLFNVPSGSDKGSCDNYNVDKVISDASAMATAAITAINNYQQQSFFSAPAPGVLSTYDSAFAMFGVEGQKAPLINRVSIKSSGSAILDKVKKNYQNVINMLESTTKLNGGKATLACDDTFLNWVVTLNDMNPAITGDPGKQTIVDAFKAQGQTFSGNPAGFYYSKYNGNTVLIQDEGVKKPDGSAGGALCTDATMDAETWSKYGFMLCCPRMFQLPANVATAVGTNGGTPKGTNINIFKTAAGAFLHEMMHFLDLNTATGTKITDEYINGQKAYGWPQCAILGTNVPDQALTNADNYHYFAVAATLSSVTFGTDGVVE